MRFTRFLMLAAATAAAFAQEPANVTDNTSLGPELRAEAPDFSLPDQTGRARQLSSLGGKNGLVLIFFRSADW